MTDVEALGSLLADLANAGAPIEPGDPAVDAIRARVGLPAVPEPDPEEAELDAMLGRKLKEKQIESLDNPEAPPTEVPGGPKPTTPPEEQ